MKSLEKLRTLCWREEDTPDDVRRMLSHLGAEYPLRAGGGKARGLQLRFKPIKKAGALWIRRDGNTAEIQYASLSLAARALGCVWSGASPSKRVYEEKTPFKTLGFMADCSRNSVLTVSHFKKWLRRSALLGYNQAMLYTQDVYELPGEPYFGYMRGAYTESELRELDDYASELGIEMVACITTLGHLGHVLKWPAYAGISDTGSALLTEVPETYKLIDKMLSHWSRVFRSRRIHLGMDEAVDIGKGYGSDRVGSRKTAAEIFFKHLHKVAGMCEKRGLKPMIWSDLVFWADTPWRQLGEAYYDLHLGEQAAKRIKARLPENVELVYWDYTPDTPAPYVKRIAKHRAVGSEPIMAPACHVHPKFWHDAENLTVPRVAACVKACRQTGVKELLMTLWTGVFGVDLDSAWAGLAFAAEQAFHASPTRRRLENRYRAIIGADYQASVAGALDIFWISANGIGAAAIFYDDPLQGVLLRSLGARALARIERGYRKQARLLNRWRGEQTAGDMDYARQLADFLARKTGLAGRFQIAYRRKSVKELRAVRREIGPLLRSLSAVRASFRRMWLRQFKPFGMETAQMKLAGLEARFVEMDMRLGEFLDGSIDRIDEMEVPSTDMLEKARPRQV